MGVALTGGEPARQTPETRERARIPLSAPPGDSGEMESPAADPIAPDRLAVARALLTLDRGPEPAWPALAAAAFFAVCALGFAFGAIMAPSANLTHMDGR